MLQYDIGGTASSFVDVYVGNVQATGDQSGNTICHYFERVGTMRCVATGRYFILFLNPDGDLTADTTLSLL